MTGAQDVDFIDKNNAWFITARFFKIRLNSGFAFSEVLAEDFRTLRRFINLLFFKSH